MRVHFHSRDDALVSTKYIELKIKVVRVIEATVYYLPLLFQHVLPSTITVIPTTCLYVLLIDL
jgi:hypothetical protein